MLLDVQLSELAHEPRDLFAIAALAKGCEQREARGELDVREALGWLLLLLILQSHSAGAWRSKRPRPAR
jgi:hypothetical protein